RLLPLESKRLDPLAALRFPAKMPHGSITPLLQLAAGIDLILSAKNSFCATSRSAIVSSRIGLQNPARSTHSDNRSAARSPARNVLPHTTHLAPSPIRSQTIASMPTWSGYKHRPKNFPSIAS